jgi:amino acid transporter
LALKLGGASVGWNLGKKSLCFSNLESHEPCFSSLFHSGFTAGIWEYFIAVIGMGIGYLMLALCMAEMVSILTFDGGYYGYARVILGPLGGYLVGCCGLVESVFYFGAYPLKITQFLNIYYEISHEYDPLIWVLIYTAIVLLQIAIAKQFWNFISIFTLCTLVLVAIYLFGSMPYLNYQRWATHEVKFNHDPQIFFDVFRLSNLFYMGFDLLTLTSSQVKNVRKGISFFFVFCFIFF